MFPWGVASYAATDWLNGRHVIKKNVCRWRRGVFAKMLPVKKQFKFKLLLLSIILIKITQHNWQLSFGLSPNDEIGLRRKLNIAIATGCSWFNLL